MLAGQSLKTLHIGCHLSLALERCCSGKGIYARFTPNHDRLRTDLRVEKFWISWTQAREQSLNFNRQIASYHLHRCQGATDMRVNEKCIIGQVIRATCSRTMTDLRARETRTPFYHHKLGPQNHNHGPTTVIHLRPTSDWPVMICNQPLTWAWPPRVTCVTQQKFAWDKNFKSDSWPIYDCAESHTRPSNVLRRTCKDLRPKEDPALRWVTPKWNWQVHLSFLMVKSSHGACRF